jgi:hypothetical protein
MIIEGSYLEIDAFHLLSQHHVKRGRDFSEEESLPLFVKKRTPIRDAWFPPGYSIASQICFPTSAIFYIL